MVYYAETNFFDHDGIITSGGKGRDDIFEVMRRCGFIKISIPVLKRSTEITVLERLHLEPKLYRAWQKALSHIGTGDILFIHNPPSEKYTAMPELISSVKKRGCRIVTVVFDLETYLTPYYRKNSGIKYMLSMRSEKKILELSDHIIVHNDRMKEALVSSGISCEKITAMGALDYLRDDEPDIDSIRLRTGKEKPLVFCGNLAASKSAFLRDFPDDISLELYGPGYECSGEFADDKEDQHCNIRYMGTRRPLELMDEISGSFGLVWDGDSSLDVCGVLGEYLRFNNPHKMSLYLASGLPVIVWKDSAMAEMVTEEGCGITAGSLAEARQIADRLSDDEYDLLCANAIRIGAKMRKGMYTEHSLKKAVSVLDTLKDAYIIFTREPEPGHTKTRLMPYYNAEQCAELHKCFLKDIKNEMKDVQADIVIAYTGREPVFIRKVFGSDTKYIQQRGDDLGQRMENAISDVLSMGYDRVVLTGSDIPELRADTINRALAMISPEGHEDRAEPYDCDNKAEADVVIGPTVDGGYYLVGMSRVLHEVFRPKIYGRSTVFEETMNSISSAGLQAASVDRYHDIDTQADLTGLRDRMRHDRKLRRSESGRFAAENASVSVIIPVFNEKDTIGSLMNQLRPYRNDAEIIFVDGGSTDGTADIIGDEFTVLTCSKCRGKQMNYGAENSSGDILFFLHCDSSLPPAFINEIRRCMTRSPYGCFGIRFRSGNLFMLSNRVISNSRARIRGLPFGDQGIFIDRDLFFDAGMFPDLPVMEDYEFAMRIRKRGFKPSMTRSRIVTSDRRYGKKTSGILKTELMMWDLRRRYRKGENTDSLADKYADIR